MNKIPTSGRRVDARFSLCTSPHRTEPHALASERSAIATRMLPHPPSHNSRESQRMAPRACPRSSNGSSHESIVIAASAEAESGRTPANHKEKRRAGRLPSSPRERRQVAARIPLPHLFRQQEDADVLLSVNQTVASRFHIHNCPSSDTPLPQRYRWLAPSNLQPPSSRTRLISVCSPSTESSSSQHA